MPTAARVDVQILSDTVEKNKNNLISRTGGKLDDRGPCFPKLLTGLCIGQVVMLIATAATLGAVIRENIKEIDDLKQRTQMTENYIHRMESKLEAVYVGMTTLQTTTGKDTSNLTTANDIFNTSLFITKLHLMKNRTDTLESTIDTLGKDLSSLKTDVSVQEHLIQNNTYRIADLQFNRSSERRSLELQVAITEGLKADFESQGDNLLALNDTAIHLKALMNGFNYTLMNGNSKIVQLDADLKSSYDIINVHSSRIDLLESNRTADRGLILNITSEIAIFENRIILLESNRTTDRDLILRLMLDIDNHDDYMIELKSNMTADRRQIMSLSTVVSNIEANLTSTSKSIKTQSEILMTVNETLLRLETATNQLNIISKAYTDGLAELEEDIERKLVQIQTDIETNLENIVNNTDKIRLLEVNVTSVKNNAENLSVILSYLESEMESINGEVQNNHDGMASLIVDIQALNGSTSDSLSKLSTWLTDLKGTTQVCGHGWIQFGDKCYYFSKDKHSWSTSLLKCRDEGGYLAEIDNDDENTFIKKQAILLNSFLWLGGSDQLKESDWIWVTSMKHFSSGLYTDWQGGQPSNSGQGEHCLSGHTGGNGYWNDNSCSTLLRYVCEANSWL